MTNPQKEKGSRWERAVVDFLRSHGFRYAERAYGAGRPDDRGDIDGIPFMVISCKDHKRFDLSGWLDDVDTQRGNARRRWGVVVAKRPRRPASEAYVTMTLETFAAMALELDR